MTKEEVWAIMRRFFEGGDFYSNGDVLVSEGTKKEDSFRRALAYREESDAPQPSCPSE